MIDEKKLKKCPFCGGEATICSFFFVQCSKCGLSTLTYLTESEAIEAWNTRKPMDRIMERLEEEYMWNDTQKKEAYEDKDWETFDLYAIENRGIYKAIEIVKEEGDLSD